MTNATSEYIADFRVSLPGLSLEELGLRALQNIPRERAINGIHAFNEMRSVPTSDAFAPPIDLYISLCAHSDHLLKHLRPIAEQNREVTAADIHAFFEEAKQAKNASR